MIIKCDHIFSTDGLFHSGIIQIRENRIEKVLFHPEDFLSESYADSVLDATNFYIIPGLVDIHLHGCAGADFCDGTEASFERIVDYEAVHGITSIVPATMTLPKETLADLFRSVRTYREKYNRSFCGVTMEGPFLSPEKKGAQDAAYICKPDISLFHFLQDISGHSILQVAVAPEEDADFAFIKEVSSNTVVSLAHTNADYETAIQAFAHGASHVTHLFNAMPGFHHRNPGIIGAAFDNHSCFVELICDGIHLHPAAVRATFALFGSDRICMISDSMMATGMPDGTYALGGQSVTVKGNTATLADGTIAGSVSNLYDCLKTAVLDMNLPLEDAVRSCTMTPAKSLGLEQECGSIAEGRYADLVFLDKDLNICNVMKNGTFLHESMVGCD